jgi:two-component system, chemotaxis family, chemotaxis protein CheY
MPPTRVLIVDDSKMIREQLKEILIANGMEIAGEAEQGIEAVKKCQDLNPDITIMDVIMPIMDGVQATRVILNLNPSTKIIICSVLGEESMVVDAMDAGARDHISKPFKAETVTQTIKKVLTD